MNGCHSRESVDGLCNYSFKVMLIGDSCVGKTCLLVRFKDNTFLHNNFIATVGMDYRNKTIDVDGAKVKLQIWDTAGQERFRCLTHTYYRDADAIILAYDVAARSTFLHTRNWLEDVSKYARDDVVVFLVGNKSDLSSSRQVTMEEGLYLAERHKIAYLETSGKTGANVDKLFKTVGQTLIQRRLGEKYEQQPAIDLNCNQMEPSDKKNQTCCW